MQEVMHCVDRAGTHLEHQICTLAVELLLAVVHSHKALLLLLTHGLKLPYHLPKIQKNKKAAVSKKVVGECISRCCRKNGARTLCLATKLPEACSS